MYGDVYSVAPSGVFVPLGSPVQTPADLAGVPVSVGYQSGSHYSTIQALEQYLPADQINLSFNDGMLFKRMELLIDGQVPACALFSGPYYFAEQLGFRKVIDTTFMIATMLNGDPDPEDVRKYFRALRRAQRDIDLRPELYTHYYKNEFPERFHDRMDTRRWGPGERLVFEPYSKEVFEESFEWIAKREIFGEGGMGPGRYEEAVVSLS
jgi:ABC-type nitrate/sulfonate/bicarbonate transport system substrate-binding protein